MARTTSPGRIRVKESIVAAEGDLLKVEGLHPVNVAVIPTGGSEGKVQYTLSPLDSDAEIAAATWADWVAGAVSARTESVFDGPVTGLKLVKTSGASLGWEVAAG